MCLSPNIFLEGGIYGREGWIKQYLVVNVHEYSSMQEMDWRKDILTKRYWCRFKMEKKLKTLDFCVEENLEWVWLRRWLISTTTRNVNLIVQLFIQLLSELSRLAGFELFLLPRPVNKRMRWVEDCERRRLLFFADLEVHLLISTELMISRTSPVGCTCNCDYQQRDDNLGKIQRLKQMRLREHWISLGIKPDQHLSVRVLKLDVD